MRLCREATPKQYLFVSSITSAMKAISSKGTIEEKQVEDPAQANGLGYGQSKLVAERLALRFAARSQLPVTIARVGQIAGDTVNGRASDAFQ